MPPVRATRGRRPTFGAVAALALVVCLVAGCGKDSKAGLSQQRASTLRSSLDQVEARVRDRDCTGAAQQASAFRQEVAALPARVNGDLRDALARSGARLESLVADNCQPVAAPAVEQPSGQTTVPDQKQGEQHGKGKQDKKPKKQKQPKDNQQPGTGGTGQEGTGVTGQGGGAAAPEVP